MLKILQKDNKILRQTTKRVERVDAPEIKSLIRDMAQAMFEEPDGIGIAAPQVGAKLKIFLVAEDVLHPERFKDAKKRTKRYLTFINPVLKKASRKKSKDIEGCLSVREIYGEVTRPEKVTIEYTDEHGSKKHRGASGLLARVLQHEMDHLEGTLFINKAKNIKHINLRHETY